MMASARSPRLAFMAVTVAVVLASTAAASTRMAPSTQTKTTKSYVYKLSLGMSEQMWTAAQVKVKHPTTGEVMLMGSMMSGGSMGMGGSTRHLEVHIMSRSTGKTIMSAHPTMTATDAGATGSMMMNISVAEMRGVTAGSSDTHYGNNLKLVPGHMYKVTVKLHGESATFSVRAPK